MQSHKNLRPLETASAALIDIEEESKVKMLAKQVVDPSEGLENAKLKVSGLQTIIEVS